MNAIRRALTLLLMAIAIGGAPAIAMAPPTTATVSGTVNLIDGVATAITVEVQTGSSSWWTSGLTGSVDANTGAYSISGITPGTYRLLARPRTTDVVGAVAPGVVNNFTLTSGESKTQNFTLTTGGSVSGTVKGPDGNPLAHAGISTPNASSYWENTYSDASGNFTLRGLTTGVTDVSVGKYGTDLVTKKFRGTSVTLGSDTPLGTFRLEAGHAISGVVYNGSSVVGNATVGAFLDPSDASLDGGYASTTSDPVTGAFTLHGLRDSAFRLSVSKSGLMGHSQSVTLSGSDLSEIAMQMSAAGTVTGVVRDETGTPLSGVAVSAWATVSVPGADGQNAYATTNELGAYRLSGLGTGTFRISFNRTSGNYMGAYLTIDVAAGETTSAPDIVMHVGGAISGRITANGAGLANATIQAYRNPWSSTASGNAGYTSTDSDGNYTLNGLASGTFNLTIRAPSSSSAMSRSVPGITVVAPETTSGRDFALASGGSISGRVVDEQGTGISSASVSASGPAASSGDGNSGSTSTDGSGNFTIRGLAARTFSLTASGGNYIAGSIADIAVTPNVTTPAGDIQLHSGGAITGTVRNSDGEAISAVSVSASRTPYAFGMGGSSGYATTDSSGHYRVQGLSTGNFRLSFSTSSRNFVSGSLSRVAAMGGETTANHDITLETGGTLAGSVTLPGSADPAAGICVSAWPTVFSATSGSSWGWASTSVTGGFAMRGLRTGAYTASFSACGTGNYVSEQRQNLPVAQGSIFTMPTLQLTAGGSVSGTITASADGTPVSSACVSVSPVANHADSYATGYYGWGQTDDTGAYSIIGLRAGSYKVRADASCATDLNLTPVTSSATAVTQGSDSTVNLALAPGAQISGTVRTTASAAVPNACVWTEAPNADPSEWNGAWANTDVSGQYSLRGLAAGSYRIHVTPCDWTNSQNLAGTTLDTLTVAAGASTTAPTAVLQTGGKITGKVLGLSPSTTGVEGMCVYASSGDWSYDGGDWGYATTDAAGDFAIKGLASGTFTLGFSACGAIVPGAPAMGVTAALRPGVVVTSGATTASGSQSVIAAGGISGTVRDGASAAIGGVCVSAEPVGSASPMWGWTLTEADGTYQMKELAPGAYRVQFSDCMASRGYADEWYNDAAYAGASTAVTVTSSVSTPNINATLAPQAQVSGTVRDSTGAGLGNVCVNAFAWGQSTSSGAAPVASTTSGADGTYVLAGVNAGDYRIGFIPCGTDVSDLSEQWLNGKASADAADQVHLVAGDSLTGQNATLPARPGASASSSVQSAGGASVAAVTTTDTGCTALLFVNGDCTDPRKFTSDAISPQSQTAVVVSYPSTPVSVTVDPSMLSTTSNVVIDAETSTHAGAPTPPVVASGQTRPITSYVDVGLMSGGRTDAGGAWDPALKIALGLPKSAVAVKNDDISVYERTSAGRWSLLPNIGSRDGQSLGSGEPGGYYLDGSGASRQAIVMSRHAITVVVVRTPAGASTPPDGPAPDGPAPDPGSGSGGSAGGGSVQLPHAASGTAAACTGMKASAAAICLAKQRKAAAIKACSKAPKAKRAACTKKARTTGAIAIKKAQCGALPAKKRAACLAKASKSAKEVHTGEALVVAPPFMVGPLTP